MAQTIQQASDTKEYLISGIGVPSEMDKVGFSETILTF
jgi:hypothetical protein